MKSLRRAFLFLWIGTGLVLLWESMHGMAVAIEHGADAWLPILGATEALGAVAFLVPRTMRFGAAILIGVLVLAFGIHLVDGQVAAPLLAYLAAVIFVAVHGPVKHTGQSGGGQNRAR